MDFSLDSQGYRDYTSLISSGTFFLLDPGALNTDSYEFLVFFNSGSTTRFSFLSYLAFEIHSIFSVIFEKALSLLFSQTSCLLLKRLGNSFFFLLFSFIISSLRDESFYSSS